MPREFYRRHLPHYQPPTATYHVVFRLAGSLPAEVIDRLMQERLQHLSRMDDHSKRHIAVKANVNQHFEQFDALLDCGTRGP